MPYEYKVVPAPSRGLKGGGKGEDRFAHALASAMNEQSALGWEYLRAEALPAEERRGLLRRASVETRYLLVFRRARDAAAQARGPELAPVAPAALDAPRQEPPAPQAETTSPSVRPPSAALAAAQRQAAAARRSEPATAHPAPKVDPEGSAVPAEAPAARRDD
ncbi:DUF4177 domain-containing protein [Pseudoroseicyclus aestuarii]|uniref:Uncharacterized protein DUF4177 n=1 Tax=Pseudoroseicyclus aestuarii TaxID=1795041 RepID=A0A318T5D0_9RHOB|nr:DUF4177 domain-containing protein [Pseudoroseicyclus aestuarii]PYE82501.1 uncharacterized protein DUF4177 [Pseudoroseicyclus aestuarii]